MASPRHRAPLAVALLLVIATPLCDAQCATLVGQDIWEISSFYDSECSPSAPIMKSFKLTASGCSGGQLTMTNVCLNYPHATTATGGGTGDGIDSWAADWLTVAPSITSRPPNGGSAVGPTSWPECPDGQALSNFVATGAQPNGQYKWGCHAIDGGGSHTPTCYDYETSCTTTVTAEMMSIVWPECVKSGVDGAVQKFAVKVGGAGTSCPANNAYVTYTCCFASPLVGWRKL